MDEHWLQINDFPNYQVSNFGNVRNIVTNKPMKLNVKGGYDHVCLVHNKIRKSFKVHRLVALAFIPNPENKLEVNHKDKNKLHNHIDNLEWMTRKENNIHRCIGITITNNQNKRVSRLDPNLGTILEKYNSIEDAAIWALKNELTKNSHNGRNAIGNCVCGLSKSAYGFKWQLESVMDTLEEEIWKPVIIENIENTKSYYVSNLGRFKNSRGIIMDNYKVNENGYIRVFIYNKTYALHRLVALAFIENSTNREQVNHIDGNKLNNTVSNLEWNTCSENNLNKFKIGLGNNYTRKIVQYDLKMNKIKDFDSIISASKELNIGKCNIQGVLTNRNKSAGGFVFKYLEDNTHYDEVVLNNKGRKVVQYNLEMNKINIFNSIIETSIQLNIHKNNIWGVINNYRKSAGGFIFKYLEENI
jgi:hypothetical protein